LETWTLPISFALLLISLMRFPTCARARLASKNCSPAWNRKQLLGRYFKRACESAHHFPAWALHAAVFQVADQLLCEAGRSGKLDLRPPARFALALEWGNKHAEQITPALLRCQAFFTPMERRRGLLSPSPVGGAITDPMKLREPGTLGYLVNRVRSVLGEALDRDLSQAAFGALIGFNKDQVRKLETGLPVDQGTLARFAEHFGLTQAQLQRAIADDTRLLEAIAKHPQAFTTPRATAMKNGAKPTTGVGNPTVDLPFRTRHTNDTPLADPVRPEGEEQENVEMYNTDRVALIATVLAMTPEQVRGVREYAEFLKGSRDDARGKARG
jgi:hypothetical protein